MHLNIKVTGPAGLGMNSTADIIAEIFAKMWYEVIGDIEYQSLIKWGVNWFDINISENSKYISKKSDIIIAFNDTCLEKTLPMLVEGGFVIANKKWVDKVESKWVSIRNSYNVCELEIEDKYENTYLLWVLAKLLNLDLEIIFEEIETVFWKKWEETVQKNKDIVKNIYETFHIEMLNETSLHSLPKFSRIWPAKKTSYWNKMLAHGAIASELEFYSAYPMTPASSVLTEIINSKKVNFLQPEDEIAVINAALWASFAWKRSMVWTSWGGFALMTEALSFAVQAEIWVVVILSQRAGPSTWTPTFHEAWDLNFALNCVFWVDSAHVVLAPSSLEEWYYLAWKALNIADMYQCPVIILVDKQFSEGNTTIWELISCPVNRGKIELNPTSDYKRFSFTDDCISPRTYPWIKDWDFIATSYEHDEYGATSENPELKEKMTIKREEKLANFFEKEGISGYEIYNPTAQPHPNPLLRGEGITQKKVLIVTSFTSYTAKEFVKNNPEYGLIIVKFLKPLDERLVADLAWVEELTFVENNYSGALQKYMTKELSLDRISGLKISYFRKYDLYPFFYEDFEEKFL